MTDEHKTKPQGRDELTASRHQMGDAGADWRGVSDFQKARARLLALSRTAAKVQSVLEPHRVFETMGNELRDLGLSCFFGLLSDPGDTVRLRYTNFSPEVQKAMETLRRAPTGDFGIHVDTSPHFKAVVRNGEAVFERDASKILAEVLAPVLKGSAAELTRLRESGRAISAPLVTGREALGVLTVWSDDLAEEDVPAVSVFAQQAAMAIENAGLYQEEMRRVFEMEALRKTTLDITRQLDVPQLLRSIVERASSLVGTKGGALYLHDPEREELELVVSHLLGEDYAGTRLKVGEGLSGRVVLTGEPLIVQDYSSWEGRSEKYVDAPFKAVMGVPLKWGDKIIGVVNVTDVGQPRTFSDRDLRLLESFGNQAAIAIENARAYASMERRVAELTALREISLQLTQSLDLSTVLDTIANSAVKLVNASDAHIFLYDQERGEFTFGTGVWAPGQEGPVYEHVRKNGLTATVARRREPVVLNEARTDPLFQDQESHGGVLEAIAGFPLKRADRVLGVFNVAFLQPHRFDQEELRVLTLLADQAAIAVDNARLYEETTQRLRELATLHETAVAATSTVDFEEVLERIIGTLERRLGFTNLALILLDEEDQRLKVRAGTGYAPEVVDRIQPLLGEGITGTVALTGEPLNIPDVAADPRYIRSDEDVKSELCVPLEVGGRVIGVLNVESVEPAAFADDDLRLLSTLAGQLAVIIENARLYQETDRRLRESETLQEVSRLVNSSLEPDQIFQTVVETLASAFGYSMVSIYMMDGEGLRLGTEVGYGPAHAVDFIPLDKGVIGRVARTGEAELLYDVTQDPDYLEAAPGVVSEIAVPVMRDSQVLGVLNVESTAEEPLTVPDLRLVSSLSHQVSVAIQNAQLYQAAQRELAERKLAEQALRESEEKFRSLAERSPNMIFINKKGKVLYANQKCEEIMGYTREQFYSADFDFFTLIAPECIDLVAGSFDKHSTGEDVPAYEYTLVTEQGKRIEAILATSLISYGGESAILGIVTDITERKRSEEELQRSYDRLQTTLAGTVNALAALAEARDPYTAGHQQRVAHLGCAIAEEMALSGEKILGLRMAGLVHDIGKIYVPAEILSKPADLTAIEMQMIKTHPQTAHNILKEVEFPWAVAQIVLQHHERMDGSGYPQGLAGDEMLLEAKILGVADVVEAMASNRPYRPAHGIEEALEEISQHRGTLYDADVADTCLKLFRERGLELQRA